jgi:hypothetical protein
VLLGQDVTVCSDELLKEVVMALVKTWYDVEAAAEKFGIKTATLLFWAAEGLVRSEREGGDVVRVHIDDVRLQVADMLKEAEK